MTSAAATSTSPPNHRLPKRCPLPSPFVRRSVGGVEGIYSRLNQNQMSVPANIPWVRGQAAIIWMICQQWQELMAPRGLGMGWKHLLPAGGLRLDWKSLNCCLLYWHRMQPFFLTNDVFSQKDKGKGWKGESGEGQVTKRRNKAKLSLQKCRFCHFKK